MGKVKITNPQKLVFKKEKVTKQDIVDYYLAVSPLMLDEIKNRPITAFRCHGGIDGECFYKKHPSNEDITSVVEIDGEEYFFISSVEELIYQVQMGTIEFHTWACRVEKPSLADQMVFDLDPAEDVSLNRLREATRLLRGVLLDLGLEPSLKTSGGKGFHVCVRLLPTKWEEFSQISRQIADLAEAKFPDFFTTNMRKSERKGKIYLDYLRNKKGASCVAAYSLRARAGATISLPISWEKLDEISPNEVNIKNYRAYIEVGEHEKTSD